MKKLFLAAVFVVTMISTANASIPGEKEYRLVTENYTVQDGDTLESIAEYFIKKNTYAPREIREFREGIRNLNYDIIGEGDVVRGETIQINYWIPNQSVNP